MPDDRDLQSNSAVTLIGSLAYLLFLLGCFLVHWILRSGL
jgi:hypothetical protein